MDEQNYRLNLLEAANHKLEAKDKMYKLISRMSNNAYIYYDFEKDQVTTVGNWSYYFPFEIENISDLNKLGEWFDTNERINLNVALHPELSLKEHYTVDLYNEECRLFYRFYTNVVYDEQQRPLEKCIAITDITDTVKAERALKEKAFTDTLTGLVNHNHFCSLLDEFIQTAKSDNAIVSIILVDIDDFRSINQNYERSGGDELIKEVAEYLKTFVSKRVMAARLQMDLFALALLAPDADMNAHNLVQKIEKRFANAFVISDTQKIMATACIGVAEYPEAGQNAMELIKAAETVLYRAKTLGKANTEYFTMAAMEAANEKQITESRYHKTLAEKSFFLNFQPQYGIADNELRAIEVLVRWLDADGNVIAPNIFIPIAEKNGTLAELGRWILEDAIATYAEWKSQFDYQLILALHISAVQYKSPDFVSYIASLLNKYQMNPKSLELEITEKAIIEDWDELYGKLMALHDLGVRIALDDFGSKFCSINLMKKLPIDTVKFHKSFFLDNNDEYSKKVASAIVALMDRFNIHTVAMGIESVEELHALHNTQCAYMQGFLWGAPSGVEGIIDLTCGLLLEEFIVS